MKKKAFTLIEVLVFVTIVSLLYVAAIAVTTFMMKNSTFDAHKILATHYAEEAIEWVKSDRERDWIGFTGLDTTNGSGTRYCITVMDWTNPGSCNKTYFLGTPNIFTREVVLTNVGSPLTQQVEIEVTVSWQELSSNQEVTIRYIASIVE